MQLVIGTVIGAGSIGIGLDVTIAGSNAPGAVEIKLIKEDDVATKSLSKLPAADARGGKTLENGAVQQKKSETNLAKFSQFGKELEEEVYSLGQLVMQLVIGTVIGAGSIGIGLGDHIIFATHRPGAI